VLQPAGEERPQDRDAGQLAEGAAQAEHAVGDPQPGSRRGRHNGRIVRALEDRHPDPIRQRQENELDRGGEDRQPADEDVTSQDSDQADQADGTRPHPVCERSRDRRQDHQRERYHRHHEPDMLLIHPFDQLQVEREKQQDAGNTNERGKPG